MQSEIQSKDPVIEAIDQVTRAVGQTVEDEKNLLGELERVRQDRKNGRPLRESLGQAGRPLALVLMQRIMKQITGDSGRLRHAFASGLLHEGESKIAIARRFEVTHQRISAILSRNHHADSGAPAPVETN